jgi:hypothetical protein
MLRIVGVNYFEKEDGQITPTDLIELDYEKKLKYEFKIKFNENIMAGSPAIKIISL